MIEATIARDAEGFPSLVTLQDGAKRLEVAFDRDSGFTISGSRRSFTQELLDVLRMIYPATIDFKFHIPEPLSVVQVQGGSTVLFDDMEALLKWQEVGATVALDNTFAYNGSQSLQLTAAAGGVATAARYFPVVPGNKYKLSFLWAVDTFANLTYFDAQVNFTEYDVQTAVAAHLLGTTSTWQILQTAGYTNIEAVHPYSPVGGVGGAWHKTTLFFDLQNRHYGDLIVNEKKWNLEGYETYFAASAAAEVYGLITLEADAEPASNVNVWIEDLLLEAIV